MCWIFQKNIQELHKNILYLMKFLKNNLFLIKHSETIFFLIIIII